MGDGIDNIVKIYDLKKGKMIQTDNGEWIKTEDLKPILEILLTHVDKMEDDVNMLRSINHIIKNQ